MATAFVLMQTDPGLVEDVLAAAAADPGVEWVDPVTGPYDLIAALGEQPDRVLPRLRDRLDGALVRTLTCPVAVR